MPRRETCGFVFATTGPTYTSAARRAARNLRLAMPQAQIDLFTNQPVEDAVFDRIHSIASDFFRPKLEAMIRSRFDRTIYLDSDVVVLCDVSEIFDLLDSSDLAVAHGRSREVRFLRDDSLPRAFPMLNAGVIAFRRTRLVHRLLRDWSQLMHETGSEVDQGLFRDLLYHKRMPFIVLPIEYNLLEMSRLSYWAMSAGAPRILHIFSLNDNEGDATVPFDLQNHLRPKHYARLQELIAADRHWPAAPRPQPPRRQRPLLKRLDDALFRLRL